MSQLSMSDVFISYARSSEEQAKQVEKALRDAGYSVWRDDELPAHRTYADVIEERLKSANAVVVLWSAQAIKSQWVRAEADAARELGTLVQASVDGTMPPMPFNQIQCADLKGWDGSADETGWRKLKGSITALAGRSEESAESPKPRRQKSSICVLPFANMSGDEEQAYFSDGITEDIITDLSKVSALEVVPRNTAFRFKGQLVDARELAEKLGVSHILEGSVRKAGNRLRISAQLINGIAGGHLWAERFDRELTDIFAIQDEISKAIVDALQVKLLPQEKTAIETRGTSSVDAYDLYLMARQQWIGGTFGDVRRAETIVRFCREATTLDANYAEAWALMALAQAELQFWHGKEENALPAAERALVIKPQLAEARCVKARYLEEKGKQEEANREIEQALKLDSESWEVNREAGRMLFRHGHVREAIPLLEKAVSLMDTDWQDAGLLITCYKAVGDEVGLLKAARRALDRAEREVANDPTNAPALAMGILPIAILGDESRARQWLRRALLLDPDNLSLRYYLACALTLGLADKDAAIDMLQPYFERVQGRAQLRHLELDDDLAGIRDDPRFQKMLTLAKQRLGMSTVASG